MDELAYVEVSLAEHCNLNCAGCSHFSPLAEPEFADPAVLRRDFERLSVLFKGKVNTVRLMGGEPLLHPQLLKILSLTREVFSSSEIQLVTNGLLIPRMETAFFQCCRANTIHIRITEYPVKGAYHSVLSVLDKYEAAYSFSADSHRKKKEFHHLVLDPTGGHDALRNFNEWCTCSSCTNLRGGRLYLCPVRACVKHFASYFDLKFPLSDRDSLDIHREDLSTADILAFLRSPCPFCEYCNCEKITYGHAWQTTSRSVGEWT